MTAITWRRDAWTRPGATRVSAGTATCPQTRAAWVWLNIANNKPSYCLCGTNQSIWGPDAYWAQYLNWRSRGRSKYVWMSSGRPADVQISSVRILNVHWTFSSGAVPSGCKFMIKCISPCIKGYVITWKPLHWNITLALTDIRATDQIGRSARKLNFLFERL